MEIPEKEYLSFDDVLIQPRLGVVDSRDDINIKTTLAGITLHVPIVSSPMEAVTGYDMAYAMYEAGGLGVVHRFMSIKDQYDYTELLPRPFGIAIGLKDGLERAHAINASFYFLDVAHGHSVKAIDFIKKFKLSLPGSILVAGSVATREGARDLLEAGADALRVGIGPGHACSTRIQTGCGVPQLTAIMDCADVASEYGKDVIADGGIRTSGDIVKSLAAGASCVMIGRLFAGADEAPMPGEYFGQASAMAHSNYVEGVAGQVPMTGPVANTINELMQGVRSGISYAGAYDIDTLQQRARFIRVSSASAIESLPKL